MTTHQEMLDIVGRATQGHGWVLTVDSLSSDTLQVTLRRSTSPYGAASSRDRAQTRVSVLSALVTEQVVADMRRQCTFTPPPGGGYVCVVCGREYQDHHHPTVETETIEESTE